jgi:phospholipase/carboxylesterase
MACTTAHPLTGTDSAAVVAPARERVLMIALHGLATSPADVERFSANANANRFPLRGVRWIFPKAPTRRITLLGGRSALAWYDIRAWDRSCMDEDGIEAACATVSDLISSQRKRGVPAQRIVLAGFSQGGVIALHAGLRLRGDIGGIVALSAALPFPQATPAAQPDSPPVFLGHGLLDTVVPFWMGLETARLLLSKGYRVHWRKYTIGHTLDERELSDIARWLDERVPSEVAGRYRTAS